MANEILTIAAIDQTNYILQGSLTLKLNTLDFSLTDPVTAPLLDDAVTFGFDGLYTPWSGAVVKFTVRRPVNRLDGHLFYDVSAVNTAAAYPSGTTSPFDLNDASNFDGTTLFELEDGSGHILLESGTLTGPGSYLTEGPRAFGFRDLSFALTRNRDATASEHGRVICFQSGLWPGMTLTISLTSPLVTLVKTIRQVTVTWPVPAQPAFVVEFGTPLVSTTVVGNSP